ncbi:acyltransferase [Cohnella faecalis]|uniref:Acyltransferase n=1 Tax=Cohnella faecalis TaxID=2315694 RepID=A0A398CXI6_9BACL|nr:acyltransferase [Cohnella faecalis]
MKTIAKSCGNNVACHTNVYFFNPENISIGNNVSIHPMCYIDASGGIEIGSDVSIAHGNTIMSATHAYENVYIPIADQGIVLKKVVIKDNVWLGAKATIVCGVTIHSGSIVGANSVITKDTLPNSIVGGVPAKVIKYRGGEPL